MVMKCYVLEKKYTCAITQRRCISENNPYKNQPPDCDNCEVLDEEVKQDG